MEARLLKIEEQILEKQNESTGAFHDKMDAHILRVEPVIKAFEDDKVWNEGLKKKGGMIIWWAAVATAVGTIYFLIRNGLIK